MKRILSFVLAAVCVTATLPIGMYQAEAATLSENMLENGTMETGAEFWFPTNRPTLQWMQEEDGNGYLRVTPSTTAAGVYQDVRLIPGEKYCIQVDLKTETKPATMSAILLFRDNTYQYVVRGMGIFSECWTKKRADFTFTGYNDRGEKVSGDARLVLRFDNADDLQPYDMDNVGLYSYQKVESVQQKGADIGTKVSVSGPEIFQDVDGHWAQNNIEWLEAIGAVQGDGDGNFYPEDAVTRAELVQMIYNLEEMPPDESDCYTDVSKEDWYFTALCAAKQNGWMADPMLDNGACNPEQPLTREEAASMLVRCCGLEESKELTALDSDAVSDWAVDDIRKATAAGFLIGDESGNLCPQKHLTRGEMAAMFKRFLEREKPLTYYVDAAKGNDNAQGTEQNPFQTIAKAQECVRKHAEEMDADIYVYICGEDYTVTEPLQFSTDDSGRNGYTVHYAGYQKTNAPSINGKKVLNDWSLYDKEKNIYRTWVGTDVKSRQFYVDGYRATKARFVPEKELFSYHAATGSYTAPSSALPEISDTSGLQLSLYHDWNWEIGLVEKVQRNADTVTITMKQPYWANMPGNATGAEGIAFFDNAYEFLDEDGEWYLSKDGYMYYKPRPFENPEEMEGELPVVERLVEIFGNSADAFVHNLVFENLRFEYATYLRPEQYGSYTGQNNIIREPYGGAGTYREHLIPAANIEVTYAGNIAFFNCDFSKLGTTALNFNEGVKSSIIDGCEFYDISGSAMNIGKVNHDAQKPVDDRDIVEDILVSNNYVHQVAREYKSASAIGSGFPQNCQFSNNEIFWVPYSGFHVGYGWGDNLYSVFRETSIVNNYIHDTMNEELFDGGAIYTLGGSGATSDAPILIQHNYLTAQNNKFAPLYADQGSSYELFYENVIDLTDAREWSDGLEHRWALAIASEVHDVIFKHNFTTTETRQVNDNVAEVVDTVVCEDAVWPETAQEIVDASGFARNYSTRFCDTLQKIETEDVLKCGVAETLKLQLKGTGRKHSEQQIDWSKLYFSNMTPELLEITEDGTVTTKKAGIGKIKLWYCDERQLFEKEILLEIGDKLASLKISNLPEILSTLEQAELDISGKTAFNRDAELEQITLTSLTPELVTVEDRKIIPTGEQGEAQIEISATSGGTTVKQSVSFEVKKYEYGTGERVEDVGLDFNTAIQNKNAWAVIGSGSVNATDSGLVIDTKSGSTKSAVVYKGEKYKDELLTMNVKIAEDAQAWYAFSFRADSSTAGFGSGGSEYTLIWTADGLELSKFINKKRTVFFGSLAGIESLGGPLYPNNCFDAGSTHKLQLGAVNVSDGVKLIVNIDDVNVLTFVDRTAEALTDGGYFKVYANGGKVHLAGVGKEIVESVTETGEEENGDIEE